LPVGSALSLNISYKLRFSTTCGRRSNLRVDHVAGKPRSAVAAPVDKRWSIVKSA
jgi:hypothetical protein